MLLLPIVVSFWKGVVAGSAEDKCVVAAVYSNLV